MLSALQEFFQEFGSLLVQGSFESLIMIFVPTALAYSIGLPLGVLLYLTAPASLIPCKLLNRTLGWMVNMGRSIPFIILMIAIFPFTRLLVGTAIGIAGVIPPLTLSAVPFVARIVEQSIKEIEKGKIEAAQAFGANLWQLIVGVIIPECLPSLVRGLSITLIAVFGYSAMAGAIGAGGLGDIAIRYGYYRKEVDLMIAAIVIAMLLIQVIQSLCDTIARRIDKRNAPEL